MPQFSPVPKSKDTGTKYDTSVVSSGPYKIQSYVQKKSLTLVRNENWDPKTDTVRKAYPDKIVATFGIDPNLIDSRLIADAPADQTAMMIDTFVQAQNVNRVLNTPALKARVVNGYEGSMRYLAINWKKVPDQKVREAIYYAIDKETYRGTRGGTQAGDYATSMITPALASHKKFDHFPASPNGDPEKAKQLLTEAGKTGLA
jgi:peptide/nickel transport system substrate-binding protein